MGNSCVPLSLIEQTVTAVKNGEFYLFGCVWYQTTCTHCGKPCPKHQGLLINLNPLLVLCERCYREQIIDKLTTGELKHMIVTTLHHLRNLGQEERLVSSPIGRTEEVLVGFLKERVNDELQSSIV